jgi:hypothetical protein
VLAHGMVRAEGSDMAATLTVSKSVERCRRKFLSYFPEGFADEDYVGSERDYKWQAHLSWKEQLGPHAMQELLAEARYEEIARSAVRIEARTNLLFSFEKMALRDAVRTVKGARQLALGLYAWLYGSGKEQDGFEAFVSVLEALPRRQTRVLTWPLATVFGFIAQPRKHIFLKPNVTRLAAKAYGHPFEYRPRPSWETYKSLLDFARAVKRDTADLLPRDMIDVQSFIWVLGSDEYP